MLVEQFFYIDYDKISIFPEKNIGKEWEKFGEEPSDGPFRPWEAPFRPWKHQRAHHPFESPAVP